MEAMVSGALIEEVVDTLLRGYGPIDRIILFGSVARGEHDSGSDVDLIVIKETRQRFVERLVAVPDLPVEADVFVYTPEEFEHMKRIENPFLMSALEHARVLYPRT